ncbi:molybdotransferase-like divisome protein Glp [Ornithinimicrobium sediminis]|uniref:molybdotransferase-like divisome protein Glp n=1 Tax=Ornithinimicrobium sediminis TaxID=2904603 RepID=UPI001E46EA26|nr:gephyrin-like molybdotransferase Glp [Ornithinimicrobium sediminis]MCE0485681.1 molybdopterin molybdotransferase MoeA [Ornithinimicrobium sediminis]
MIPVDEHLAAILRKVRPNREVELSLARVNGLVTTQDVTSPVDLPRFDNSAMDGYAVLAEEVRGASPEHPVLMPVQGDIPAGDTAPRMHGTGTVWRIMTGAPMPQGSDAVVPVEDTDNRPRETQIRRAPKVGAHIRRAGEDLRVGDVIVPAGTTIGPAQVAVLASAGVTRVRVNGPVRVVVLSTGDELVPVGQPLEPGQIVDSNGPMLAAAVREAGYYAVHVGHLPDDEKVIKKELDHHLSYADAVITSGGVSKGAYDAVKAVLSKQGAMTFTEVAMQPGKPQGFGVLGRRKVPVFTLPGNPVSALVSFEVFVRPALARRAGRRYQAATVSALVAEGWRSPEGKTQYARVGVEQDVTGTYAVRPAGGAGSHLVGGLAAAEALAVVPPEVTEVAVGSEVDLVPLRPWGEIEARLAAQRRLAEDEEELRSPGRGRHRFRT